MLKSTDGRKVISFALTVAKKAIKNNRGKKKLIM